MFIVHVNTFFWREKTQNLMMNPPTTYLIYFAYIVSLASAYPFVVSERECRDMFPEILGHDADHSDAPYDLTVTQNMYIPGGKIIVTIKSTGSGYINGFFLQARRGDCGLPDAEQNKPVGHFLPVEDRKLKVVNCSGSTASAVVNKQWYPYTQVETTYVSPDEDVGPIYFRATVVESDKKFWTEIFSEGIRVLGKDDTGKRCPTRLHLRDNARDNGSNSQRISYFVIIPMLSVAFIHRRFHS